MGEKLHQSQGDIVFGLQVKGEALPWEDRKRGWTVQSHLRGVVRKNGKGDVLPFALVPRRINGQCLKQAGSASCPDEGGLPVPLEGDPIIASLKNSVQEEVDLRSSWGVGGHLDKASFLHLGAPCGGSQGQPRRSCILGEKDRLEGFGLNISSKVLQVPHDQRVLPVCFQKSRGQGQKGGTGVKLPCHGHQASLVCQRNVLLPQVLRAYRFREGYCQRPSRTDPAGPMGRIAGENPGRDQVSGQKRGREGGKSIPRNVRSLICDCERVEGEALQRGVRSDNQGQPIG